MCPSVFAGDATDGEHHVQHDCHHSSEWSDGYVMVSSSLVHRPHPLITWERGLVTIDTFLGQRSRK